MSKSEMICTVCQQPKSELTPRRSELIENLILYRCGVCHAGRKEPRWAIVMAAMTMGNDAVRNWVINHRYVGDEIKLKDVV